jgi:hypothetical protein
LEWLLYSGNVAINPDQTCVLFNIEPIDNKTVLMEKQLHPVNIYIEFLSFPGACLPFWLLRDI